MKKHISVQTTAIIISVILAMIIPETAKAEDANILRQGESFVIDDFARMTPVSFGYLDSYILNIPAKGEDDFGGQKIVKAEKGAESNSGLIYQALWFAVKKPISSTEILSRGISSEANMVTLSWEISELPGAWKGRTRLQPRLGHHLMKHRKLSMENLMTIQWIFMH